MSQKLSVRAAAAQSVDRIMRSGAYSNVIVQTATLSDERDRALYQRLVYTALRHVPSADSAISLAAGRPNDAIDAITMAVLRVGVSELLYMSTPDHAVVSETVNAAKQLGRARASSFVNAVLRSVSRDPGTKEGGPDASFPPWIAKKLREDLGEEAGALFMEASNAPTTPGLRFRDGSHEDEPIRFARYAGAEDDVSALEASGRVDVIDPASTAVVNALQVAPGDTVLDLAAAPGGKTRALAEAAGSEGTIVACDLNAKRLIRARRRSPDHSNIAWVAGNALVPPFRLGYADRVLLDAPCTGLGTLRRRPEIRYRVDEAAPGRYGSLQREMVEAAIGLLAPGGRLVYSVCTVFPEETTDVVAGLGFVPPVDTPGSTHGDGMLLAPHINGTDGMFIAVHERVR